MHDHDTFRFDGDEYDPTQIRISRDRNRIVTDDTFEMRKNRTVEVVFDELALPINEYDKTDWFPIYCRTCGQITDCEMVFDSLYEDPRGYVYVFDSRGQHVSIERDGPD